MRPAAVALAPSLVDDDARKLCALCTEPFTTLRRRHHCRCCGDVVCAACSGRKRLLPLAAPGYDRERRVCDECLPTAGTTAPCAARCANIIVSPSETDPYRKQEAVRQLATLLASRAKAAPAAAAATAAAAGSKAAAGPPGLREMERCGGCALLFRALAPFLSDDVPLDVCAHACELLGAALFMASQFSPAAWRRCAAAMPPPTLAGLLACLEVAPAREKAARVLYYVAAAAAAAPPDGGGGSSDGKDGNGRRDILKDLHAAGALPAILRALASLSSSRQGIFVWLCAAVRPLVAEQPKSALQLLRDGFVPALVAVLGSPFTDAAAHACAVLVAAIKA
ncbi:unnamed protein product, partial [Phaeothamnion confervicola]